MEAKLCVSTKLTSGEELWSRYFPEITFSNEDHRVVLFRALLQTFFSTESARILLSHSRLHRHDRVIWLDYTLLEKSNVPELKEALLGSPIEALTCLAAAGHQAMTTYRMDSPGGKLRVRLFNFFPSQVALQFLKANWIGKLATVKGNIIRLSPSKPLFISLPYSCAKCGWKETRNFPDGVGQPPGKCSRGNCRSRRLNPELSSAVMIDWQKIRLQETLPIDRQISGGIPRTIDVEVTEDLINSCVVGETVVITGIVKVINSEKQKTASHLNKRQDVFVLYLDAISIDKQKESINQDAAFLDGNHLGKFSRKDLDFISEFHQYYHGDQLKPLVQAFCPNIHGHDLIKAGILLSLVGGVGKQIDGEERVPIRGDIHVLLVGDPGMGKSELLKATASIAPRGVYVCGSTSSGNGLTASVVKDNATGDFSLEGGAMVLAHKGVCCIDEFDKILAQHQSLLEAMEQQEVSIAKAGLVASLPSKTTVIAAANPAEGHYQRAKTIKQNLKIEAPMLSRFDLVFLMIDKPDSHLDMLLSDHILSSKTRGKDLTKKQRVELRGRSRSSDGDLVERLRLSAAEESCKIPETLLRKYLCYARFHVHPKLTEDAIELLKEFYLKLRNSASSVDELPITARQLESLIRLSESRAKIDLREEVTAQDAKDAICLMREALYDKYVDEHGIMNSSRRKGYHKKMREVDRFLMALKQHVGAKNTDLISLSDIYWVADDIELQVENIQDLVERLNNEGELLKRGPQVYKVPGYHPTLPMHSTRTQRVTGSGFSSLR